MDRDLPIVGVIMGSDSDWEVMRPAVETLEEFQASWEVRVSSAHRTPEDTEQYVRTAEERGLQVLIAGAGGAAHLPGVLAAYTVLPVIGIPVRTPHLGGADSLYSIVQMPPGVPVATVGINAARNAALLAVQILGGADTEMRERFRAFKASQAERVRGRNARLQETLDELRGGASGD